jgi:hypothetical protein
VAKHSPREESRRAVYRVTGAGGASIVAQPLHAMHFAPLWMALVLALGSTVGGCAGEGPEYDPEDGVAQESISTPAACDAPNTGCPCSPAGKTASCAATVLHEGSYVSCWPSHRVCEAGVWSACEGEQ